MVYLLNMLESDDSNCNSNRGWNKAGLCRPSKLTPDSPARPAD